MIEKSISPSTLASPKRYPWPSSIPSEVTSRSCVSVSMPSAQLVSFNACDSRTIELFDKRPVDLDLLEWKGREIAERGITHAKIVERDRYAEILQLMQRRE